MSTTNQISLPHQAGEVKQEYSMEEKIENIFSHQKSGISRILNHEPYKNEIAKFITEHFAGWNLRESKNNQGDFHFIRLDKRKIALLPKDKYETQWHIPCEWIQAIKKNMPPHTQAEIERELQKNNDEDRTGSESEFEDEEDNEMAIDNNDEEEALQTVKIERDDEQSEVPGLHDQVQSNSQQRPQPNISPPSRNASSSGSLPNEPPILSPGVRPFNDTNEVDDWIEEGIADDNLDQIINPDLLLNAIDDIDQEQAPEHELNVNAVNANANDESEFDIARYIEEFDYHLAPTNTAKQISMSSIRILSPTNSGPGSSSTHRTTSKFKNNEELLQNSASVSATMSMSTSTSLAPPLVFEHNHAEKTATLPITESPPLLSLNYREHEPIVRNNGKPRRLLRFNDNGLSKRTVVIKTFKQPKEATQVQISQNTEEASDDDEESGPVKSRPPPVIELPHLPKVRVKIPDIRPIVRKFRGCDLPNKDQLIVYEHEMSNSMTKERQSNGLKRVLSSSAEEEEDPDQPGTSQSIGKKKKPKRSGQQNKPTVHMKPKKRLDTRNSSPVLNDTDLDATNTSFSGRAHYSIIDETDTDKDNFICVECPPGRGESLVKFQGKAPFNWHMLIKHKTVMEESKEMRSFIMKQSRISLASFVFECEICRRPFNDFKTSVSERALQWQLHRMSDHGDEDLPQGNIADIVSRIANEKSHPFLSIIKKEEPHILDNEEINDIEWTGNGNRDENENIKILDPHKKKGPQKKKTPIPNTNEKRKIKREPTISSLGSVKKTKTVAWNQSNEENGKADEEMITNLEVQNREDNKNGQNEANIDIGKGSTTEKRFNFASPQQQANIVIVAEEPQQEVEDDNDVRESKIKGYKPKKQTQKRKSKAEETNFTPPSQNIKIADLLVNPFVPQQQSTSASSYASATANINFPSTSSTQRQCQYCPAKFDYNFELQLHISSSHLGQLIRSTKNADEKKKVTPRKPGQ